MSEVIKLLENIAKYHCTCPRSWPRAGRHDDSCLVYRANKALSLLRQQPEGKFTSQWRERLKNAETLYRMGRSADDWFGSIVSGFRESLDVLDRQGAELKLYRKNFCEAHQPLPEDTYEGCYCCDLIHLTEGNARLKKQIIELKTQLLGGSENDSCAIEGMDEAQAMKDKLAGRQNGRRPDAKTENH